MKIVLLDGKRMITDYTDWDSLSEFGDYVLYSSTTPENAVKHIGEAEIVLCGGTPCLSRNLLEACPNIKYIGATSTGYNFIDLDAAKERGIVITNVPSYGTQVVPQSAFSLLLEVCNRVGHYSMEVKKGRWTESSMDCALHDPIYELYGKTIGIIGFGKIGTQTGRIAHAFGMRVLYYDLYEAKVEFPTEKVELDQLYGESDVIILHCPLFPETYQMINQSSISKMKDGVILINNSRGALVNEDDLAEALNMGKLYGAGLDVTCMEPINEDNPLLKTNHCFITPHMSWCSREGSQRILAIVKENIRNYLNGRPTNVVK